MLPPDFTHLELTAAQITPGLKIKGFRRAETDGTKF